MFSMVINQIKDEITASVYFALLVDESKDIRKSEQISFVIRYLFNNVIHEEFIGFYSANGLTAECVTAKIKDILANNGIDIQKCVAQGYDGANVMSGDI